MMQLNIRSTCHIEFCCSMRGFAVGHITSIETLSPPSHSQGVGVGSSLSIVQYSHLLSYVSSRASGPSDSGSRSTSGDTGEGEVRAASIEVRVHSQCHVTWYGDVSCKIFT